MTHFITIRFGEFFQGAEEATRPLRFKLVEEDELDPRDPHLTRIKTVGKSRYLRDGTRYTDGTSLYADYQKRVAGWISWEKIRRIEDEEEAAKS